MHDESLMKILAIYRHYWPDVAPYGKLLRILLERFAQEGHEVTVFTAQPSYNDARMPRQPWREVIGGVRVVRTPLLPERKRWIAVRMVNMALFLAAAFLHALTHRTGLVMAHSTPPVFQGLTARAIAKVKRIPFVFHVQDIYPEVGLISGFFRRGALYNLLRRLDGATCRGATRVVTLSGDMAQTLRARGYDGGNIEVINNFSLPHFASEEDEVEHEPLPVADDAFMVLYAGNHGLYQGLEHVVDAAHDLRDEPRIQFLFQGEGAAKPKLVQRARELRGETVHFIPYQPFPTALRNMRRADLSIISLEPEMIRYSYPSKTMTYLEMGSRLLVIVEPESELGHFVRQHDLGRVVPPKDSAALREAVLREAQQARGEDDRRRVEKVSREAFGVERNMRRWLALIDDIGGGREPR